MGNQDEYALFQMLSKETISKVDHERRSPKKKPTPSMPCYPHRSSEMAASIGRKI